MKYCQSCGKQIDDDATFCPNCGAQASNGGVQQTSKNTVYVRPDNGVLWQVAFVFMILGCVFLGLCVIISLAWTIPMTVYANNKVKAGEPLGTGFKVCVLLFVSMIAGILLLCRQETQNK